MSAAGFDAEVSLGAVIAGRRQYLAATSLER